MANGYTQALYESIPGNETNTPTPSTKVIFEPIRSLLIKPNPNPLERDDETRGVDEPIAILPELFAPDWDLDMRAYPDPLGFELKAALGAPVSTAGNGIITDPDAATIPAGATRHVWTAPYGPAGASPLTTQRIAAYKDDSVFLKAKGCATAALALDMPESGGMGIKASGPAAYVQRVADPALSPAYESLTVPPFTRAMCSIATQLTGSAVSEDFSVGITVPVVALRTLGIASAYPDVIEKDDPPIVISGSIPKRHIDLDDYDALLAATSFTLKVKWLSTVVIGATAYKYTLWLECNNAQYVNGQPNPLMNARRLGATFDWKATYGGSAGSSKWTLVNGTASYA